MWGGRLTLVSLALSVHLIAMVRTHAQPMPIIKGKQGQSIRLWEHLAKAKIQSPLVQAKSTKTFEHQGSKLMQRFVLKQDFEKSLIDKLRWPKQVPCRRERREDGDGYALRYLGGGGHKCFFVLPAKPSQHYQVHREILTADSEVDLRVYESRVKLAHPKVLNHPNDVKRAASGKFIKAKNLLFVHHFPPPLSQDSWQGDEISLFTSPFTNALVVVVHDAESSVGYTERDTWFDNLFLKEITPDPQQAMDLWKMRGLSPGADPRRGMLKHDQLLPIHNVNQVKPPFDANHDFRTAIFAPAPTRIQFRIQVPKGARLLFSYGIMKTATPNEQVRFHVYLKDESGTSQDLLQKTLCTRPQAREWHWHEGRISLQPWWGKTVTLGMDTFSEQGRRGHAVWGHPVVDVPLAPTDKPNVILIAVDTLRADRLSCYGYNRHPKTSPHIDRLAEDGVLFRRTIASSNWTTPSFASLFLGQASSRHQVVHRASKIPDKAKTLAEYLSEVGYLTAGIVYKTYLYDMGFEQGFDVWFNLPRIQIKADDNLKKALLWLEKNHDRRFFLFLHFNDPHQPFNQPEAFVRRYRADETMAALGLRLPIIIGPHKGITNCSACLQNGRPLKRFKRMASDLYDGEIAYLDDRLGLFFKKLKELGLYEDSLIVFLSDHGEVIYEVRDFFGHGSDYLGDELVRVPLIVKAPKSMGFPSGRIVEGQVRLFDVMPTVLDLVSAEYDPEAMTAKSLVPILKGRSDFQGRMAFSENVKHHALAIRHLGWEYRLRFVPNKPVKKSWRQLKHTRSNYTAPARPDEARRDRFRRACMEFFLRNKKGKHLLVLSDHQADKPVVGRYQIEIQSERILGGLRPFWGLPSKSQRPARKRIFQGSSDDPVLLFARFPARVKQNILVRLKKGAKVLLEERIDLSKARIYEEGELAELIEKGPGIHLLINEHYQVPTYRQKIDPHRLEVLRSLGYVE